MIDYTELVKALRICGKGDCVDCDRQRQDKCLKRYWNNENLIDGMFCEAAAAIEELQQIADHYEQTAKDYWEEACEYKAQLSKRGEWIENDNGTYSCNRCGSWIPNEQHYYARYCLYCGAKMEVQE